jgi:hypothetical protein
MVFLPRPLLSRGAPLTVAALLLTAALQAQEVPLWSDIVEEDLRVLDDPDLQPHSYRNVALDLDAIRSHLAETSLEEVPGDISRGRLITLPLPDGRTATYRVVESPVMAPGLQARFPSIRTYVGADVDDPSAVLRLSITPHGLHGLSRRGEGTLYIDSYPGEARDRARTYWRHDMPVRSPHHHPPDAIEELFDAMADDQALRAAAGSGTSRFAHGEVLRVYRAAIAARTSYTRFHSADEQNPTVQEGLAAVVVAMNRVNQIFERDLGVRFVLVENNDRIIYTGPEPYTATSISGSLLTQNQVILDSVIGQAKYDIGHLFTAQSGGLAQLASVCTSSKARGATGLPEPTNDPFYVDYLSHEIGHQLGANHTFNAGGFCGTHRVRSAAFEPGSGSTIMAYAGVCGAQNIAVNSDDYFHNESLREMINFINSGAGSTCGSQFQTGNTIPDPIIPTQFSIPTLTPFALPGGANYAGDPAQLTFVWEGMNGGPAGAPPGSDAWSGGAPFFRSYTPSTTATRFFPRLDYFMLDQRKTPEGLPLAEGLPAAPVTLNFRLTVRNNAAGGGAVKDRLLTVPVRDDAGPFVVTSHTETDSLLGRQVVTITWDVAGTDRAVFGGERVDVLLSLDREKDFVEDTAIPLAKAVPNSGSAVVIMPQGPTASRARFFLRASDGFFFGFNQADIHLEPAEDVPPVEEAVLSAVYPNPLGVSASHGTMILQVHQSQSVRVNVYDALGRRVMVLHEGPVSIGTRQSITFDAWQLAAGIYYARAVGEDFALVRRFTVVR